MSSSLGGCVDYGQPGMIRGFFVAAPPSTVHKGIHVRGRTEPISESHSRRMP